MALGLPLINPLELGAAADAVAPLGEGSGVVEPHTVPLPLAAALAEGAPVPVGALAVAHGDCEALPVAAAEPLSADGVAASLPLAEPLALTVPEGDTDAVRVGAALVAVAEAQPEGEGGELADTVPQPLAESLCEPRLPVAGVDCEGSVVPEGTPLAVPDTLGLGVSDGLWLPERDAAGEAEGGSAVCEGAEPLGGADDVGDPESEREAEAQSLPLREGAHVRLTDALGLLNGEHDALPLAEAQAEPVPDVHGEGLALALPEPRREKVGAPEVVGDSEGERDAEALGEGVGVRGGGRLPEGLSDADAHREADAEGEGAPLAVGKRDGERVDDAQPVAVWDDEGEGLIEPLRGEEGVGKGLLDALPHPDALAQGVTPCVAELLPLGGALPQADPLNDALSLRRLEVVPLRVCEGGGEALPHAVTAAVGPLLADPLPLTNRETVVRALEVPRPLKLPLPDAQPEEDAAKEARALPDDDGEASEEAEGCDADALLLAVGEVDAQPLAVASEGDADAEPTRDGVKLPLAEAQGEEKGEKEGLPHAEAKPDRDGVPVCADALALPVPKPDFEPDADAAGEADAAPELVALREARGDAEDEAQGVAAVESEGAVEAREERVGVALEAGHAVELNEGVLDAVKDALGEANGERVGLLEIAEEEEMLVVADCNEEGEPVGQKGALPEGLAVEEAEGHADAVGDAHADAPDDKVGDGDATGEALSLALLACDREDETQGVAIAVSEEQAEKLAERLGVALEAGHAVGLNEGALEALVDTLGEAEMDTVGELELAGDGE